jgi:UDP-glucose 4-epimerase
MRCLSRDEQRRRREIGMKILVTGSAGHLGEALVRSLSRLGEEVIGLDILQSPFTACLGSIADRA